MAMIITISTTNDLTRVMRQERRAHKPAASPKITYRVFFRERRRTARRVAALIIESVPISAAIGAGLAVCGKRVRVLPVAALACTETGVGDAGTSMLDAAISPSRDVPAT